MFSTGYHESRKSSKLQLNCGRQTHIRNLWSKTYTMSFKNLKCFFHLKTMLQNQSQKCIQYKEKLFLKKDEAKHYTDKQNKTDR